MRSDGPANRAPRRKAKIGLPSKYTSRRQSRQTGGASGLEMKLIHGAATIAAMRISVAERVFRAIRDAQLVRAGDRLGVAVSGGGDSVALLLLLLELRERLGVVLSVVHVNHKLRGRASEGDEKFAARLAAEHNW